MLIQFSTECTRQRRATMDGCRDDASPRRRPRLQDVRTWRRCVVSSAIKRARAHVGSSSLALRAGRAQPRARRRHFSRRGLRALVGNRRGAVQSRELGRVRRRCGGWPLVVGISVLACDRDRDNEKARAVPASEGRKPEFACAVDNIARIDATARSPLGGACCALSLVGARTSGSAESAAPLQVLASSSDACSLAVACALSTCARGQAAHERERVTGQ
jgi:hypothetical protein